MEPAGVGERGRALRVRARHRGRLLQVHLIARGSDTHVGSVGGAVGRNWRLGVGRTWGDKIDDIVKKGKLFLLKFSWYL